jgi:hypothetical protein
LHTLTLHWLLSDVQPYPSHRDLQASPTPSREQAWQTSEGGRPDSALVSKPGRRGHGTGCLR